ncbi:MAG: hypothetical protein ABSE56_18380 [Bryobacteraceae bacterium]|jgi:hypothetical protein
MTKSREDRVANLALALKLMTEDAGENALYRIDININAERYRQIYATTWKELLDRGLVEYFFIDTYHLTTLGWRNGVQLMKLHEEPAFRQKMSKLAAILKDQVTGRREERYLHVSQAARITGLPEDLIYNMLESKLLDHCFNMNGATLQADGTIVVPIDFGQEPL